MKIKVGDVIRFRSKEDYVPGSDIPLEKYLMEEAPYLMEHKAFIVMSIHPEPDTDMQLRLRPVTGKIAMTKWLHLLDGEVEIDLFLTAVNKAQKPDGKSKT